MQGAGRWGLHVGSLATGQDTAALGTLPWPTKLQPGGGLVANTCMPRGKVRSHGAARAAAAAAKRGQGEGDQGKGALDVVEGDGPAVLLVQEAERLRDGVWC